MPDNRTAFGLPPVRWARLVVPSTTCASRTRKKTHEWSKHCLLLSVGEHVKELAVETKKMVTVV